jgi:hypothetical protein
MQTCICTCQIRSLKNGQLSTCEVKEKHYLTFSWLQTTQYHSSPPPRRSPGATRAAPLTLAAATLPPPSLLAVAGTTRAAVHEGGGRAHPPRPSPRSSLRVPTVAFCGLQRLRHGGRPWPPLALAGGTRAWDGSPGPFPLP